MFWFFIDKNKKLPLDNIEKKNFLSLKTYKKNN